VRYLVLVCDYDGTIARDGRVDDATLHELERVRASGRRLFLVTGRELDDLQRVIPRLELFDRVIAENGALLFRPEQNETKQLCGPPPAQFVQALRKRHVAPLSVGQVIVATWEPNEGVVIETIHDLGLELQVIFNKGAVMVLPSGMNKAAGLEAALAELALSPHNAVGIGDAENDHAFLNICECAVAVANALPSLKQRADLVTDGDQGAGAIELAELLLEDDLASLEPKLSRHHVLLGEAADGSEVRAPPYGINILLAGPSGSGKSTLATAFLERLRDAGYQFCIVDPEGDYETFDGAVVLGDRRRAPTVEEALELLAQPAQNAIVNLLGLALDDRPAFLNSLLPRLQELRAVRGRPHWIVIDEAHQLLPATRSPVSPTMPQALTGFLLITVHPEHVSQAILERIDWLIAVGGEVQTAVRRFAEARRQAPPGGELPELEPEEALLWPHPDTDPLRFRIAPPQADRARHRRKYAHGELGPDKSFYFRGPDGALNLRAQNLFLFLQLADGVDDDTWLHHLRRGEYSRCLREAIKDDALAEQVERVEKDEQLSAAESRSLVRAEIEERYTVPA